MLDIFINIDTWLFHFANSAISNWLFDRIMPFITNQNHWFLIYIFLPVILFWKGGKTGKIVAVLLIITVIIADQTSSSIIKPLVNRLRPCHTLVDINLLVPCGGGKSFPSSHAVNNFAEAVILSHFYSQYKWICYTIASMVAFSRVYVGVHYPSDIIGGAFIGIIIALIVIWCYKKILLIIEKKYNYNN